MLNVWGQHSRQFCDRLHRRDFLQVGALGLTGLTLADLLRLRARGAAGSGPKGVIMIYLNGGPPHMDMYDMKPDAPADYRGELKPIQTSVPGLDICELMPRQARIADKLALIRNMYWGDGDQGHAYGKLLTGTPGRPSIGSVISYLRRGERNGTPPYVALDGAGDPQYLGIAHRPFTPGGEVFKSLTLGRDMTAARMQDRKALVNSFDMLNRDLDENDKTLAGMDEFRARAFEMIGSSKVRDAFDISKEPDRVKASYGGVNCFLQARRLVEAGIGFVTMTVTGYQLILDRVEGMSWDLHGKNFHWLRQFLPRIDQGLYGLVTDLHQRGLDKDVVVVLWGEMGRTPRINKDAGRDHWWTSGFTLMAGGGLQMGQAVGATDARGEQVKGHRYTQENVHATLYHVLGIDPATTVPDRTGRPVHLLDDRNPIKELI